LSPAVGTRIVALVEQAGWAELAAVPAGRLAPLPAEVATEQAAALPLAGLTALRTLRLAGDLLGRRVLVTGANGGVGRIQIQLAAVDREGLDRYQCLAAARMGVVNGRDDRPVGVVDYGFHAFQLIRGTGRGQDAVSPCSDHQL